MSHQFPLLSILVLSNLLSTFLDDATHSQRSSNPLSKKSDVSTLARALCQQNIWYFHSRDVAGKREEWLFVIAKRSRDKSLHNISYQKL